MDKVHRIGPPPRRPRGGANQNNTRPRPIIVNFNWFVDRENIWRARSNLQGSDFHLEEDQPPEIEERRYRLLPIYKRAMSIPTYKARTFLNGDRLTVNGEQYTVDNLDRLPQDLDPRYLATRTDGNSTIFFSINSPLSNHHPAKMVIDNATYSCNEQWYFAKRAEVMGDDHIHNKVMSEKNPREMLKHGRRAHNHTGVNIEQEEIKIMTRGVKEKFSQHPSLKAFLMATKQTRIGESCKNSRWGTGLHLFHKDAFNQNLWCTTGNKMGDILQEQRDLFNS
jgi:hypothetical protein